ncbi:putative nuclease HARBI1 [Diachasma alloeum]|uniref:putative nuclease HARBI1 n=1 Tax=Diachasma alloeum TaxID=454923 RepID=UPI00073840EA|nr:putative nuclease HARBI1 [Diachasma alloeum]
MMYNVRNIVLLDDFLSSSSSSDYSDDIIDDPDEDVINENGDRRRIPRVQNFIETVIVRYENVEFQQNFRMNRNTFEYLLFLMRPDLEGELCQFEGVTINPEKQLYIALYVLGTPDSYRSVTTKFDVGLATAWRAVKRVVKALCKMRNYFIQWPSHRQALATTVRIEQRYGFPGVIGAVDGIHINIAAPKVDPQSYINRKGVHSIQLQVVCNDRLEFIHCYAGLPGSVHDMRVFMYSGLQQRCNDEYFPEDTHLLGDSAYALQTNLMVPYRNDGHLTIEQVYFNRTLSGTRMMVERAIGLMKARWRYFLDKLPMRRTDLIPYYILAVCILHNICLKNEDTFEYPIIIPNNIDNYAEPLHVNNVQQRQGQIKRERLTDYINRDVV